MILTGLDAKIQAKRVFVAEFARRDVDPLSIGSGVVVYFNSVRASAKIIAGAIAETSLVNKPDSQSRQVDGADEDFTFQFGEDYEDGEVEQMEGEVEERLLVTFQFLASKEVVQVGTKVLVMPGGGVGVYGGDGRGEKGVAGLSGFVGTVVDK
jgi:hypothetical protein